MIPQTPQQIRAWVDRLGVSEALAAEALGLGNTDTVMREYCSDRRHPTQTTRLHMDLLETAVEAHRAICAGDMNRAIALLEHALITRDLIDVKPKESTSHV